MNAHLLFRLFTYAVTTALGLIVATNLFVDAVKPRLPVVFNSHDSYAKTGQACFSSVIGFYRTDLKINCALARSMQALNTAGASQPELNKQAQATVVAALTSAPHESRLWLALALLQSELNQPNNNALKMSYLTAPNDAELITMRLPNVVSKDAVADPDLRSQAAGDVRLILTNRPDMTEVIVSAYKQASLVGKAFIEDRTGILDPKFLDSLRGSR